LVDLLDLEELLAIVQAWHVGDLFFLGNDGSVVKVGDQRFRNLPSAGILLKSTSPIVLPDGTHIYFAPILFREAPIGWVCVTANNETYNHDDSKDTKSQPSRRKGDQG
jgi:hypothetical protein